MFHMAGAFDTRPRRWMSFNSIERSTWRSAVATKQHLADPWTQCLACEGGGFGTHDRVPESHGRCQFGIDRRSVADVFFPGPETSTERQLREDASMVTGRMGLFRLTSHFLSFPQNTSGELPDSSGSPGEPVGSFPPQPGT